MEIRQSPHALHVGTERIAVGAHRTRAQFDIHHLAACALIDETVGVRHTSPEWIAHPGVRKLAERITLRPLAAAEEKRADSAGETHTIVDVTTTDGRLLTAETTRAWGDPDRSFSPDEARRFFLERVAPVLGDRRAESLLQSLLTLETAGDVTPVTQLMAASAP